jgi:hypothetical protein
VSEEDDLLARTRRLASGLLGRELSSVRRLLDVEPEDDDLRREWGPLLLETRDGTRMLAEVDEAKANLLLFDVTADAAGLQRRLARLTIRPEAVTEAPDDPLHGLLSAPIESIDEVSREPDPTWDGAYELAGLRLTTAGGTHALLGTHLGRRPRPGVWLLLPSEADDALRFTPLKG